MRAIILAGLLAGVAGISTSGLAVAAIPVPDPPPEECDAGKVQRLQSIFDKLYSDVTDVPTPIPDGYDRPSVCASPTEVTATVVDDSAQAKLRKLLPELPTMRVGRSLYIDVAGFRSRPDEVVSALCAIESLVLDLNLSVGAPLESENKNVDSNAINRVWSDTIEMPVASEVKQSQLSVAVVDGDIRDDHEDLPAIERRVVTGHVTDKGDCGNVPCCQTKTGTTNPYSPHAAWTIGTIAAIPGNGVGLDGLSKPKRIIAIDPGVRTCPTMWRLATALACAVEEKAEVIHYSAEPVAGPGMLALFEPVLARVVKAGALLVFPSGNRSVDLDQFPGWPNVFNDNALTVAQFAAYGSTGSQVGYGAQTVDLSLLLGNVYTTANCSKTCYESYDQTSAASAIVTGSILQMSAHENFKNCTAPELGKLLMQFAVPPVNPALRAVVASNGGQLNLHFLNQVALDAQGKPIDYCAKYP